MTRSRFSLPTIADVARMVYVDWCSHVIFGDYSRHVDPDTRDDSDEYVDVRLWATSSERCGSIAMQWGFETGSSDYDQIHGCICASTSLDLTVDPTRKAAKAIARELCAELRSLASEFRANHGGR